MTTDATYAQWLASLSDADLLVESQYVTRTLNTSHDQALTESGVALTEAALAILTEWSSRGVS